ncbi:MAG: HAMP domain-containing histidine kinase [Oscillospiraceae bacterium]|nr:HAMP domain-containing histidine kinase [Oscillospiraceae bacterium]
MLEFDSIELLKKHTNLFRDFSLPALICDDRFKVYYSNGPAKSAFPHLTAEDGLYPLFSEFDADEITSCLESGLTCRIDGAVGLSGTVLNLVPVLHERKLSGAVVIIVPLHMPAPDPVSLGARIVSKTPEILESGVRQGIDGIFKAMDDASIKADMLGAGWLKQSLELIAQNSYQILRLSSNLSQFAMYQSAPPILNLSWVDVFARIDEVKDIIIGISKQTGIPVRFNFPDRPVFVAADLEKFELAFLNILSNAFYFTKPQNEIEISGKDEANYVTLTFRDRGVGIPAEFLQQVARPYFSRGKNNRPVGAGLGLAISKTIIEAHDGGLEIESVEGAGTTVIITLPKRTFSERIELRQYVEPSLSNRFSVVYTGLAHVLSSPYISDADA